MKISRLLLLVLVAACSNGGGGGQPPPPPATAMGVFIDSPVQGLTYQSGSATPGTTDAQGMFEYTVGETLSFSVGGVELGTLPDGQQVVTPYDFGMAAENIARFLQTLDADGMHLNGIDLTAASAALADVTLDASEFLSDATTFETTIQPVLDAALGAGAVLVDAATALANLDAALDTTFEVAELAGKVLIIELPSEADAGIAVFEPLADPADSGSSVEFFLLSDTIDAGGDGTTSTLDWSVDGNGVLTLTDPVDSSVITVEKVGGSSGIISFRATEDGQEIMGSFLVPAHGVEQDLTGDGGRSFDLLTAFGTDRLTFFTNGTLSRVSDGLVFQESWTLHEDGTLLTTTDGAGGFALTVLLTGNLAVGGDTMTFTAINLSGDPGAPVFELQERIIGTLFTVEFPDPSTAIGYDFATSPGAVSPTDPVLQGLFTGVVVSGSFQYANWVPPLLVIDGPPAPGAPVYPESVIQVTGSANGLAFSDSIGGTLVGNDRYAVLGNVDILSMSTGQTLDSGFEIDNYRLTRVRWFWIETDTTPFDFLDSDLLPEALQDLGGRLAMDFELISDPQTQVSVFFEGFAITQSP